MITQIHSSVLFKLINITEDQCGRYLILQCEIPSVKLNLVDVYGTNNGNPAFFRDLFLSIATFPGENSIGGDFNCTVTPILNRSTGKDAAHTTKERII